MWLFFIVLFFDMIALGRIERDTPLPRAVFSTNPGLPPNRTGSSVNNHARTSNSGRPLGISYRYGAPVMTNQVNLYHIYYGDWSNSAAAWNLNFAGKELTEHFASNLGTSNWYKTNLKYFYQASSTSTKIYVKNTVVYGGGVIDNYSLGSGVKSLSDFQIEQIVRNHIGDFNGGSADPNGVYLVLTSPDVTASSGFCNKYCGWHTYASINSVIVKYSFIGVAPTGCPCFSQTAGSPNGLLAVDAMLSVYAHEVVEAVSDPQLNAWYDNTGYENADKCAWKWGTYYYVNALNAYYNAVVGGKNFLIQTNWDPMIGACMN